jgi:serine/threonine protein kinase
VGVEDLHDFCGRNGFMVIHRDIKLANILQGDFIKISDLGLACVLMPGGEATASDASLWSEAGGCTSLANS